MPEIDLDNRIKIDIVAIKGDTLGPVDFVFEEAITDDCEEPAESCDYPTEFQPEDLTGALFEGELLKGKSVVHTLTSDELSFDDTTSTLSFALSAALTKRLGCSVVKLIIRQILSDITTTRITGTITLVDYV
jgi:hypothetical protein